MSYTQIMRRNLRALRKGKHLQVCIPEFLPPELQGIQDMWDVKAHSGTVVFKNSRFNTTIVGARHISDLRNVIGRGELR